MMTTLSGLYESYADGHAVAAALTASGIAAGRVSLLSNNLEGHNNATAHQGSDAEPGAEAGMGFGAILGAGVGAMAGLGLVALPGIGSVIAAGWLTSAVVGAVAGGAVAGGVGGVIGAMVGNGLLEEDANVLAEGVRRGGTLVTVLVDDAQKADADRILHSRAMLDQEHLAQGLKREGWTKYDEAAPALSAGELTSERAGRVAAHS